MKFSFCFLLVGMSVSTLADTFTGVVSDVKHFHNGGVAVDLDGHWPHEKMALYLPPADAASIGSLPAEGDKVTANGTIDQYRGKPEIKIHHASQWEW